MFKPVCWPKEEAQDTDGKKEVTVLLWDYEARVGKARVDNYGPLVDVFITDYTKADLTIGVKNSSLPTDSLDCLQ